MECIPPKDPGFSGCTEFYQASCLDEEFFIKKKKKKKKEIRCSERKRKKRNQMFCSKCVTIS